MGESGVKREVSSGDGADCTLAEGGTAEGGEGVDVSAKNGRKRLRVAVRAEE